MKLQTLFTTTIESISKNWIRSILTVSGIVIGVFSIITLVSLVKGVENFVLQEFENLGANNLLIYPGGGGVFDDPAVAFQNNKLDQKHVDLINRYAGDVVRAVEPIYQTGGTATYRGRNFFAAAMGGTPEIQNLFNIEVEEGRLLDREDVITNASVAVIGSQVKEDLFSNENPIGKTIYLQGRPLEVIGYMAPKAPDYDPMIYTSLNKFEEMFDLRNYTYLTVTLENADNLFLDSKKVELALLRDLTAEDFTIYTSDDLMDAVGSILDILRFGLAGIAGISLLVGGIGIMNIMLVAVTERIREIGLRKAIGANKLDIVSQFLMESSLLSFVGGLAGLAFGFVVCLVAQRWIPAEISVDMVLLSLGFSLAVGIIFGTYPALQASNLEAIDALRHE